MNKQCEFYIKHELGQISDLEYEAHVMSCELCKTILSEDLKLLELAGSLKKPVDSDNLWDKIEITLSKGNSKNITQFIFSRKRLILNIAAVLLIGLVVGFYFAQQNQIPDKGVVSINMLEKLDEKEQDYLESIEELEAATQEKMAQLDINLMLLYRDKLEMIDAQIAECKEALADNPANAHIHKYLFAALNEKKETLIEIYKIKTDNLEENS
jgi:hypothetical protein